MNAELIIFSILLIFGLLVFLVWLAMQVQKTKDSLKIDTLEANAKTCKDHIFRQNQQQEYLHNRTIDDINARVDELLTDKENNSK